MPETNEPTGSDEARRSRPASDGLGEAKAHAKIAARSTLLALRSALDFGLEKLGGSPEPKVAASDTAPDQASSEPTDTSSSA